MKVNLVQISKINSLKMINKYKINKPIFLNNYLFHYLILTDNLRGLKLKKFPIFRINENDQNGFHIAAKNKNYNILNYLISEYQDYIYNLNFNDENFMHFCDPKDKSYLDLILKNKIDWNTVMLQYSKNEFCPLDDLFLNGSESKILKIIKKIEFDYNNYLNEPVYFNLFMNEKVKNKLKIIKIMEKKIPNFYINRNKETGMSIFWDSLKSRDIELIKYISKFVVLDEYLPLNSFNLFRTIYATDVQHNDYKISHFVWDRIKNCHNFASTNMYGDTLAHFILEKRLIDNIGDYKLEKKILSSCNKWNIQNTEKETPLHLIVQLDFKKYNGVLKNKNLNVNIKNDFGESCLDVCDKKWKSYLNKFPKYKAEKSNIKLSKFKYSHGNLFQAKFTDCAIYAHNLDKKYPELLIPKYIKTTIGNKTCDMCLDVPDTFLNDYLNFPWLVVWNRHDNYWIHPYLNEIINSTRREKKYDYAVLFLSVKLKSGGLHASLILYDFKRNTIERFDPYGNTMLIDDNIDDIFEEELTWNTGLTYLKPKDFQPVSGFQTISNENNVYNQKLGDFGGYCLAWTCWYLEHRLINTKIDPKTLISKTIKKMINSKINFNEYIRNYANELNNSRIKILKKIGIPKKKISNEVLENNHQDMIKEFLIKEM
jgi:hypothetical protein